MHFWGALTGRKLYGDGLPADEILRVFVLDAYREGCVGPTSLVCRLQAAALSHDAEFGEDSEAGEELVTFLLYPLDACLTKYFGEASYLRPLLSTMFADTLASEFGYYDRESTRQGLAQRVQTRFAEYTELWQSGGDNGITALSYYAYHKIAGLDEPLSSDAVAHGTAILTRAFATALSNFTQTIPKTAFPKV